MSPDFPPGPPDPRRKPPSSFDASRQPASPRSYGKQRSSGNFRPRDPESAALIIGWHPIMEALDAGKEFQRVLIQRDEKSDRTVALLKQLRELEIPVQRVPREKMDRITQKNHQGLVAFLSPITFQPLEELISRAYESGKPPFFVALDGVTDVRNLGAIARTAECFGATALIIPASGVAPIQEDAIKSSSGALLRLPVARTSSMSEAMQTLIANGVKLVALSEKAAQPIHETPLPLPICLILGDEEKGISSDVFHKCEMQVNLPMTGKTGSLNVSVAAGIALSHIALWKLRENGGLE
ncbi:MAG: 23S rRNA (guanosine(2251)-2'-O)-methyltransferase RlmB [Flavobacteriales bacterium]|nr:23S rRNA (guanosine(2251)-2'-O)-methyltransferase RlmB [Flavobacteriales bacterium]